MGSLFIWFVLAACCLFGLALFALIKPFGTRALLSTGTFLIGLGLTYMSLLSLTGIPSPVQLMLVRPDVEQALVLGGEIRKDVGIFILLQAPELGPIARYFWFPYSDKLAEQFSMAQRESRRRTKQGGDSRFSMNRPFEDSMDDREKEKFVHPLPQPKVADKPEEQFEVTTMPDRNRD